MTGAIASGKPQVSLELARLSGAEIISLDSLAIYREMDIGTAKPSELDRSLVPHHLLDIIDPNESFSVSQYREAALAQLAESEGSQDTATNVGLMGTEITTPAFPRLSIPTT